MDCLVALRPDLKLDLAAHPGERWEGRIDMIDNGTPLDLEFVATLHFAGDLFEGHGQLTASSGGNRVDIAISGRLERAEAWFDMWIDAGDGFGLRVDCTGQMDAAVTVLEGRSSYTCGQPDSCACEGGSGPLRMWKVNAP
jgi:hypothetical protein